MSAVLRFTLFPGRVEGHGGFRRAAQIAEVVAGAGLAVVELVPRYDFPKWRSLLTGMRVGLSGEIEHTYKSSPWFKGLLKLGWLHALRNHHGAKVLILENTREFALPKIARRLGFKVIALPHNLESFVDNAALHVDPVRFVRSLRGELESLAAADRVFCIAQEEQCLLRAVGIRADYLPYFPPQTVRVWLDNVRTRRAFAVKKHFLIIGTAWNKPTVEGMRVQLRHLLSFNDVFPPIMVAGAGTEMLAVEFAGSPITFCGHVSQEGLATLLLETRAMLVHQETGTGALTRIPEMLLAGIPIIANRHAARSATHLQGVSVYDTSVELRTLLGHPDRIAPPPPEPRAEMQRFQFAVRAAAGLAE